MVKCKTKNREVLRMGILEVKEYFSNQGMAERILEFEVSSATVALAAKALNCEAERIAKSLSFYLKKQNKYIIVVTAGDTKTNNSKFKQYFGEKASMIPFEEAENILGHPIGGVCPFVVNEGIEIYLDDSLKRFETVFPACGSSNSAIELTIPELEKHSFFKDWVAVTNLIE